VGLVWFGFVVEDVCFAEKMIFSGNRDQIREQTIEHALTVLNENLLKI